MSGDLDKLESESIFILREAYNQIGRLALLWSVGKDSNVLVWLARKAFFGRVPFPVMHVDTSYKMPEMIAFRDRMAREWGLDLVVGQNVEALSGGMNAARGRVHCCTALKTDALRHLIEEREITGVIAGIRGDEEATRAKVCTAAPAAANCPRSPACPRLTRRPRRPSLWWTLSSLAGSKPAGAWPPTSLRASAWNPPKPLLAKRPNRKARRPHRISEAGDPVANAMRSLTMPPFARTPSVADLRSSDPTAPIDGRSSSSRVPAVAIIGAGFSGTLLALHLMRRCPDPVRIHLIERSPRFGRGLAYSTGNLNHVLNVPTARMSAFHDEPDDFLDWLNATSGPDAAATPHCFVARKVFGDYVRHHLKEEFRRAAGRRGRLVLTRGEVLDLKVTRSGVTLDIDRGRRVEADIAVFAIGNFPPEPPPIAERGFYDSDRYRPDPWAPNALTSLGADDPVLLIGTGLTMIDTAVSLLDRGHRGRIHALSRRGLLPRRHITPPVPAAALFGRPLPTTATGLTRALREEVAVLTEQGGDWRAVIDGLRPATQDIWQAMPPEERARFIRHLRPWWDVHRHRMPPDVADRIEEAIGRGQLTTAATRIRAFAATIGGVEVAHQLRGRGPLQRLVVQRVVNCSGPGCDYDRIADPLIRALLDRGDIRPDRHRLGLDVSTSCALRNRDGEIWQRLYAVGPVTRPVFWEVTSVPDIRSQCEALAGHLAARLASARPAFAVTAVRPTVPATTDQDDRLLPSLYDDFAEQALWA